MEPVLGYWDIRGLRYLLAYAGVKFKDKSFKLGAGPEPTRDEWLEDKPDLGLDFPHLPHYLDGDVRLTQSLAILKHLGRKYGLVPDNGEANTQGEEVEMQAFDLIMSAVRFCYGPASSEEKRRQYLKDVGEKLAYLETLLANNGPFAAGSKVTYVDFFLYEALQEIRALAPAAFTDYAPLEKYCEQIAFLPGLREYLASPLFKVAPFFSPFTNALIAQSESPAEDWLESSSADP